ncbi:MAG TPA: LuxR C-terminal-related transcriptional regulator [Anaerolineales bacterium]|nr:LuxR C-terminal-related transcriptional regulator [Anaerolineales bacterium]
MMVTLLATKFYFPPARANLVSRPRLLERLNEGLRGPLTLIAAPAGYGKTTLMVEWRAAHGHAMPVAWLSLDEGDNDPARFWFYLISALGTLQSDLGIDLFQMLQTPKLLPTENLLTELINNLNAFPKDFVLALDDFHIITSQEVIRGIDFLLEHIPLHMHLVLLTRTDPPLAISRLRGRGQLVEIRAHDLSFTPEEATALLNDLMKLDLSASDVSALGARTEGWIAGLRLTALSMQGRHDTSEFIREFTGSNRYIVDYLGEEVLRQQDERVQSFLWETSILRRLSASLCDRITGQSRSQQILEQLETANLFVIPLDDRRGWYRYHHLFSDFLQHQLKRHQRERVPDLHRRASEWYEENRLADEAVFHAFEAQEVERAAGLIETNALDALMRGEFYTVTNWLNSLPEAYVKSRPKLGVSQAWQLISTDRIVEAESWLQAVEEELGFTTHGRLETSAGDVQNDGELDELLGAIATLRSTIGAWQGATLRTIEVCQWALERFREGNLSHRSILEWNLAFASRIAGDVNTAEHAYLSAIEHGQASGNYVIALNATEGLAELYSVMGQLRRAEKMFWQVFELGDQYRVTYSVPFGAAHFGLAEVMRQWNRLDSAVEHLQKGFEICEKWGALDLVKGFICLCRTRMAQGDFRGAKQAIQKAIDLAEAHHQRFRGGVAVATRVRLWLAQGEIEKADQWLQERDEYHQDDPRELSELEGIVMARVLLAQRRYHQALALLDRLLHNAESVKRMGNIIEILILQATARQAQKELDQAIALMEKALALAEEEGFTQVFHEQRLIIGDLLNEVIEKKGLHSRYARVLTSSQAPSTAQPSQQGILIEPLSEREIEVLQLIADGHNNREIGERLFISVGTVKRHITNIYGKLGVHSRTQAIALARELGIVA